MADKEQIIIDGVDVSGCIDFNKRDKVSCYHLLYDKCKEAPNCYFKQLARKTQEYEQIKEKYEALKLENQEGYEIVAELKHECEELKRKVELMMDCPDCKVDEYKKALDEIEELVSGKYEVLDPLAKQQIQAIISKAKGKENG